MASKLIVDQNYLLLAMDRLFRQAPSLSAGYSSFFSNFHDSSEVSSKINQAIDFLKNQYSQKRLVLLLTQSSSWWVFLNLIIDIVEGYSFLQSYVANSDANNLTVLKLPKKPRTLDELHTIIYTRLALINTKNIKLYPKDHEVWVLDGLQTVDRKFKFSIPKNSWELKTFSIEMKNCIGGYVDKVLRMESIIVNVYLFNKPYINVEIKDKKINEIKQLNNKVVTQEELLLVEQIFKLAKLITD
jgi:hypothetical protein